MASNSMDVMLFFFDMILNNSIMHNYLIELDYIWKTISQGSG